MREQVLSTLTVHRLLRVTWELLEQLRIRSLELRASEFTNNPTNGARQLVQCAKEDVRLGLGRQLIDVAGKVVALEQRSAVVESA